MSTSPLRIAAISLHTSPLAEPGGADAGGMNVVVLEQSRALARAGHAVTLFTRRTDPAAPQRVEIAPGLELVHLEAGPAAPLAKSAMEQAIDPFRAALAPHLRAGAFDLIHSHHWFSGVAALPLARELSLPHLQTFHSVAAPASAASLDAGEPAESSGRIPGERLTAERSDLVVAVSQAEARTVSERYRVSSERLAVVRPGVDIDMFHPRGSDSARCAEPPQLVFAARLQPLKAPDLALEVLARLDPELGASLLLSGGVSADHAAYREQLVEQARALGISDRVELAGSLSREQLAARLRSSHLLLLTSWSETFGLVALEAQASGVPVVAWNCAGGVREAVGPGGVLLESRDPDVWAEAVQKLLADPVACEQSAQASRSFALTRTWDASADALAAQYARVVREHAAAGEHGSPAEDPWAVADRARTVLAVHAHPDDESLATGALLRGLADAGARTLLVTATRGEEGEVVAGAVPADDARPLEEIRAEEIDAACRELGVQQRWMLGQSPALAAGAQTRRYADSGMQWVRPGLAGPAPDASPESLTSREPDLAVADLLALIADARPDVLISYDDAGTYGHPDHVRVHHVVAEASRRTGIPFLEVASEDGDPRFAWREQPGTAAAVRAALEHYRTQLTVLPPRSANEGGASEGGAAPIEIRHVGGQDDVVALRTGLRLHAHD